MSILCVYSIRHIIWQVRLAGGFFAFQFKNLKKMNYEPLIHTLSFHIGFVDVFLNYIQNPLSVLCLPLRGVHDQVFLKAGFCIV